MFFILSNNLIEKASADTVQDATVSIDSSSQNTTNSTNTSTTDASVTTSSSNHAPVSIVNYSNEVTESSDTYDYSKKYTIDTNNTYVEPVAEPTMAPSTHTGITTIPSTTNTVNTTVVATPEATVTPSNTTNVAITKRIFIGDSRTVGMQQTIGSVNGVVWSCKSSMGLSWMKSTGVPNIESQITSGTAVIILMSLYIIGIEFPIRRTNGG